MVRGKNEIDLALAKSLRELGQKMPIEKITIKDITDGAGVIRPTFYHHFQDKYALLEYIIKTDLLEPMLPLLSNRMTYEAMILLFTNLKKEKQFYTRLAKMEGPITFSDVAVKCVREVLYELVKELYQEKDSSLPSESEQSLQKHAWMTPEIVAGFYAQTMTFTCIEWIRRDMFLSPREMADAYQYMITHSLLDTFEEAGM